MKKGFTLIELLIVVAIIAILAAIAVPNFLEAQTRSKVARSKADMRTIATALEAYKVDWNVGPSDCGNGTDDVWRCYGRTHEPKANWTIGFELTTPVAYLTSVAALRDPFIDQLRTYSGQTTGREYYGFFCFDHRAKCAPAKMATWNTLMERNGTWVVQGCGPDRYKNNSPATPQSDWNNLQTARGVNYDPSNGTVSNGDIYRTQKWGDKALEIPQ